MSLVETLSRALSPLSRALERNPTARILTTVFFNLMAYITIGLPLAVIPVYVHQRLGYSAALAGLAVSLQYFATFVSRPMAGRRLDLYGPKPSVISGLCCCAAGGSLLLLAGLAASVPLLSLFLLLASRLVMGFAESFTALGSITWAIGKVGGSRTAEVISWNGITSYGGIALGAPLGLALAGHDGLVPLGVVTVILTLSAAWLAFRATGVAATGAGQERMGFTRILRAVAPYGIGLALGSVGFGVIAAFVTLFYQSRGWTGTGLRGAGMALSVFGFAFVATRLVFAAQINRRGGLPVAMVSFAVEAMGLLLLWRSDDPLVATLGCALTGAGFALVFPALGVLAVERIASHNRGSALGAYSVFLDLSIGMTGPVLGLLAEGYGYASLYLFAGLASLLALLLCLRLNRPAVPVAVDRGAA